MLDSGDREEMPGVALDHCPVGIAPWWTAGPSSPPWLSTDHAGAFSN